jgi:hypothetical protein
MKKLLYFFLVSVALLAACKKDSKETMRPLDITDFLPNSGNPGTVVTIRGTGFSSQLNNNQVAFNGTAARILSANDTALIVQAPDKGITGPLSVTINGHTVTGDTYTYQELSVHGISPGNGPAGTNIYITGAGFTSLDSPAVVTINGQRAIVSNANDTLLVATVPAGAGSGPIEVSVNGQHGKGPDFTFQSITKIKPATGGAGTVVTITGDGFSTDPASDLVTFNGKPAVVNSATPTTLVVTAPTGVQTGPVAVTINGQKTTGPVFTVMPPPFIASVAPLSGPVGTLVTIKGDYFSTLTDEDIVTVNGTVVNVASADAKQLTFTVPAGMSSGATKVVVNNQAVNGPVFTIQALGISQLLPDNGLDGTVVTVKGTGFDPVAANNQVTIGGLSVTVTDATDTTLTITMPTGFTTNALKITTGSLSATGPLFRRAGVTTFYKGSLVGYSYQNNGLVIDSKGNIFLGTGSQIGKIAQDGTGVLFAGGSSGGNTDGVGTAAKFGSIAGMAIDANDVMYVSDGVYSSIRKVMPDGTVTTLVSGLSFNPRYITLDPQGNLYVASEYNGIYVVPAGTSTIKLVRGAGTINQMAYANGFLFYGAGDANVVYRINATTGDFAQLTGTFYQGGFIDGPPGVGRLYGPGSEVYDPVAKVIYAIDGYNYAIRTISPDNGTIGTLTGAGGTHQSFKGGYKDGTLQEALFGMNSNSAIIVDKNGNIYLMDSNNQAIRKIILK